MQLILRALPQDGAAFPFQGEADLSGVRRWGWRPFPSPVSVSGSVSRRHGRITVEYSVSYDLHARCSRCLAELCRREEARFCHVVAERLESDCPEDWVEAPGGVLDMAELANSDLVLSLETAPLCKEDCLGICPVCGANRNDTPCGC